MSKEFENVLNKIILYDIGICIVVSILLLRNEPQFIVAYAIGLVVAIMNLILNSKSALRLKEEDFSKGRYVLLFLAKVIGATVVGMIIFLINEMAIILYLLGYISNFASLVLYGLTLRVSKE